MSPIKPEELECDIICVTHGHADHLGDAISISKRTGRSVVAVHELAQYIIGCGGKAEGMNIGGSIKINKTVISVVPAHHSSGIDAASFKISGGVACGYIIDSGKVVYHAGDTSLFSDMGWLGEMYRPDIVILPIGDRYTMSPSQAAIAALWLKARTVIPMHYNTFPLIEQAPMMFKEKIESKTEMNVLIPKPGEPVEV